ncbi:MAG: ABC transporter permease [Rhodobiaceae bacterium]|nr:ABC transporter permease [Rhodobiaceae bacterium]
MTMPEPVRDETENDAKAPLDPVSEIRRAEDGAVADTVPETGRPTPIVPSTGLAGRALTFVIAAMCFLACLFFATMISAHRTADRWTSSISSEITVQVLPDPARDIDAQVKKVMEIARSATGVTNVRDTRPDELKAMLEPWLGTGMDLNDLPIPRLVLVNVDTAHPPDYDALAIAIGNAVPNAVLDDHQFWQDRLRTGAQSVAIIGGLLFALVLAVMVASVVFATRGAMTGNREVIEVLHFVGAPEPFIAAEFQRHFLMLGLRAGVLGGLAAMAMLTLLSTLLARWVDVRQATEVRFLIGDFGIDTVTLVGIAVIVVLVAALTAITTRMTVMRYLHAL